jgi:NADH dehydrogenase
VTRVAVTGANGAVGRALVQRALALTDLEVVAAVRSERAAGEVPPIPASRGNARVVSYADPASVERAFAGAAAVIHLPGILVERRDASYAQANVETTRTALAAARAAGVRKLVLVSAHGADAASRNRYFATKGEAEALVRASGLEFSILRSPLVLGPGTEGAAALARQTAGPSVRLLDGGRVLHRPLDVEDLAAGALAAARAGDVANSATLELAGPTALSYRELVEQAARLRGHAIRVRSLPSAPLRLLLRLRRALLGPGFDPDALEVLLADTRVDPAPAARALGLELTPLPETIRRSLGLAAATPAGDRASTRAS